jgi:hypothetical protein
MRRVLTLAIFTLFFLPQFLSGEESPRPQPVRVALSVSGPDTLRVLIHTHVMRELEAQKDILVTEVDPHWTFQIVALGQECPSGGEATVMTSAVVLETFSNAPLLVFLSEKLDAPTLTAIGRLTTGLFGTSRHWIQTTPASDLAGLSESIVSRFRSVVQQRGRKGEESSPRQ